MVDHRDGEAVDRQFKMFNLLIEFRMNDLGILVPVIDIDPHLPVYVSASSGFVGAE